MSDDEGGPDPSPEGRDERWTEPEPGSVGLGGRRSQVGCGLLTVGAAVLLLVLLVLLIVAAAT